VAIAPRLELRQGQALVMTPQLQQAIKLLQLSNLELAEFVEAELERNPLLERAEPERREADETPPEGAAEIADADLDVEAEQLHPDLSGFDLAEAGSAPIIDWSRTAAGKACETPFDVQDTLAQEVSLADHLDAQLMHAGVSPIDRMIGARLIDLTDDWGYCRVDCADLAQQLACEEADVLRVLRIMQGFEPVGVMARSLKECLALQLADRGRFDPAMQVLIEHLELLGKGRFEELQELCSIDRDDLVDMIAEVRALTPKPGLAFGGGPAQTIAPDVFVRASPEGGWLVELNSELTPRVLMNQRYYAHVSATAKRNEDKTFLAECAASANWLLKSLDQRARTILKVAREIVRQQDGFLAFGISHLRPLNLKTIAAAIDMHESTVSRVTSNKYIATPRGLFEMKYFFTPAIASASGGEAHSAEAVRHQIKSLIARETAGDVLSDDRIVEILREAGVDIARRTVAKYRESLNLPSSLERKRRLAAVR
jgi:RNA polymerase sigma-54 factor